ncbi:MAG: tetratricopeptide repeat protein [Bacteroidales bacterium]|nr:tetratricopeptide repeat protein [Bacteroidales bacterium]
MKKSIFLTFILFTCLTLTQAQRKKHTNKKTHQTTQLSEEKQIANSNKFISATKERLIGNLDAAEILFNEVLDVEPFHDAAYFEYAQLLIAKNKILEAIPKLNKAIELNDTNYWYKIILASLYNATQDYKNSEILWKQIVKKHPDNLDYLYNYSIALVHQNKLKEVMKVYDKIELHAGVSEDIINIKHNIWIHLKKTKKAANELKRLIEVYPYEVKYYLQIADFYNRNKMSKQAISYIEKAKEIDSNNVEINIVLYDYYVSSKKEKEAFSALQKIFASPVLAVEDKAKILMRYYPYLNNHLQYRKEAFILLDTLIKAHPENPMAWSVYADFYSAINQLDKAVIAFEKVLEYDQSKYVVWEQYLFILVDIREWDKALEKSNAAKELFPNQAIPYFISGIISVFNSNWQEAIDDLEEGRKFIVENEALLLETYFYLAESYNGIKQYNKSDEYYEKILIKTPDNDLVLNNYAYSLSVREERLDYALTLAEKANKIRANQASYEDTYAWVFFKKGNLEQAEKWIKKALEHRGNESATILEHYGDILLKKNDKQKALKYWLQAKEIDDTNSDLLEKIKKLQQEIK